MNEVTNKVCSKCGDEKPLSEFNFRKDQGRYRADCKKCISEAATANKLANPEKFKARCKASNVRRKDKISAWNKINNIKNQEKFADYSRKYYEANKDEMNKKKKVYYLKNKEKSLDDKRKWYRKNKEKHAENRDKYAIKNKDRLRAARRKWENERLDTDVIYSLKKALCKRIRYAMKGCGLRKNAATEELIGCTIDFFKNYMEGLFKEGMTWDNHGEWHIDHRIPLSWFNLESDHCRKMAFSYRNMQPLWEADNIKKKNFYHDPLYV